MLSDKYPHAVASFTAGSILVLAVCYLGAWGRRADVLYVALGYLGACRVRCTQGCAVSSGMTELCIEWCCASVCVHSPMPFAPGNTRICVLVPRLLQASPSVASHLTYTT